MIPFTHPASDCGVKLLIEQHATDAEPVASRRVYELLDLGDNEGRLVWWRIKRAIEALQVPPGGLPQQDRRLPEIYSALACRP